jgi:hypothetical protein
LKAINDVQGVEDGQGCDAARRRVEAEAHWNSTSYVNGGLKLSLEINCRPQPPHKLRFSISEIDYDDTTIPPLRNKTPNAIPS